MKPNLNKLNDKSINKFANGFINKFIDKFIAPKECETIFPLVFRPMLLANTAASILLSLFVLLLLPNPSPAISIVYFVTLVLFILVFGGIAGGFLSSKLSFLYQKYQIDNEFFMQSDKVALVKQLLTFPKKITIATYIIFLGAGITATLILNSAYNIPKFYLFFIWISLSIFPAAFTMRTTQEICSKQASRIIAKHFKNEYFDDYMDGKQYMGASLNFQYSIYVFLPFFLSTAVLCASFLHYGKSTSISIPLAAKLFSAFAVEFALSAFSAVLFTNKIKKSNADLQNIIKILENKKGDETFYISTDYFSELSYTAGVINKLSNEYAKNYARHSKTQKTVISAVEKIVESFGKMEGNLADQFALVMLVKKLAEETKKTTEAVDDHVNENHKITVQTMEHVNFGLESVKQNVTKMAEITEANKTSVVGIQTLSKEINSIWEIVNIISTIADRTKIIAFNAELETSDFESENASFKNVAVNIRTLADKIMDLTKIIRAKIKAIQNSGYDLINRGNDFAEQIQEGNNLTLMLDSMYKNIKITAGESVAHSMNIKDSIGEQIQERDRLLLEIQKTEAVMQEIKAEIEMNKATITEICAQTQIKAL